MDVGIVGQLLVVIAEKVVKFPKIPTSQNLQ
jgi:hypothetical protein